MPTDERLHEAMGCLLLEYIENLLLEGDKITRETWTKKTSKIFRSLGNFEIVKRKTVLESLKACIVRNASLSCLENAHGRCPSKTASPHALAFAIVELDYNVQLTFSEQCTQNEFFKQFYKPKLLDNLFDDLFPQDEVPYFMLV